MSSFEFRNAQFDIAYERRELEDAAAGGYASFEGWVRAQNEGHIVNRLEYEAFEQLGAKEGERIVQEAIARFGVRHARCIHRLGDLAIGELAVWVGASSEHRDEAFAACRFIIDEVKHRVPIWKKEHYANGDSGWVNCERCSDHGATDTSPEAHRHDHGANAGHRAHTAVAYDYSRQTTLSGIGARGQARLAASRALVIGAGGLGCPVLAYLAGAGVGTIGIVDADRVEASNLHRQPLYTFADVGRNKAEAAAERVTAMNPWIVVEAHAERFTGENASQLLADYDLVVECSDNFATKFLVNDAAVLAGKPAVLASVYQYEGQLQVVRPDRSGSCLRCLWPEALRDGMVGNCVESGVLGPVPGVFGSLQAVETLKLLLDLPGQLESEILIVDLGNLVQQRLKAPRCNDCEGRPCSRITELPAAAVADTAIEVTLERAQARGFQIVDIREPAECIATPTLIECIRIPMADLLMNPAVLPRSAGVVLMCARGRRSLATALELRHAGNANVWSLRDGVAGLEQV